jgi:tetratricopeptide (TPR) repeat protein
MTGRFVVGDQPIIFGLMIVLLLIVNNQPELKGTPPEQWALGVLLFMLLISVFEQIAQAMLKSRSAGLAVPILRIATIYRSIGALLPIPYLGKLYMTELNQLTDAYCLELQYEKALKCMEKRNAVAKARYGENSPEMAEGLINTSYIYSISDRPELAEEFGEKGMKIFDNAPTLTQLQQENLCMTTNNLGIAYANSGKTGPALELLTRSIRIKEKLVGSNHPSYGQSLTNIGYTFLCAKEYEHAEKFLRMANAIPQSEKLVIATMKNNFGDALRGMKKLDEAEKLLVEALSMREGCLPARHPHFGYSYHNLARLYADKGDRDRAEKYFKMAIDLRGGMSAGGRLVTETKEDYQRYLSSLNSDATTASPSSASSPTESATHAEETPKIATQSNAEETSQKIDLSKETEDVVANK